MNEANFKELLVKYQQGRCTAADKAQLESWVTFGRFNGLVLSDEILNERLVKLGARLPLAKPIVKTGKLWPRVISVAAAVIGIAICIWLYRPAVILNLFQDPALAVKNDVPPGGNRATLTLANGNTINLSNNKTGIIVTDDVRYNDGEVLKQVQDDGTALGMTDGVSRSLDVTTPKGGTYSIILQDGTKVWLNADSKLEFYSNYRNKLQRIVKLIVGEAYLEVAKDAKRPFIVECKGQQVTVLGTHFNISAYSDDIGIKTTLLEGSVSVRHLDTETSSARAGRNLLNSKDKRSLPAVRDDGKGGNGVVLKPNQQSLVTANNITVKEVDPNAAIDWRNGEFFFSDEPLESIMLKLARWYNIEVVFEAKPSTEGFNGKISRYKNISKVLKMLEETNAVRFKVQGQKVTVLK